MMNNTKSLIRVVFVSLLSNVALTFTMHRLEKIQGQMRGSSVNVVQADRQGTEDIWHAVDRKSVAALRYWLDQGISKEVKNNGGHTLLELAVLRRWLEGVKYLVEQGADKETEGGLSKSTPLQMAVTLKWLDGVKYLVEQGADKEARGWLNMTPLQQAVESQWLDGVKYLVEHRADKEIKNNGGDTPLRVAILWRWLDGVKCLVEQGADKEARGGQFNNSTPLSMAVELKWLDGVKYLVEKGADKEARGSLDMTPLLVAVKSEWLDGVKYLVGEGADRNVKDYYGGTLLDVAVEKYWLDGINYLVERGAIVNSQMKARLLSLMLRHEDLALFELLERRGLIESFFDDEDFFKQAVRDRKLKFVDFFIKRGANPYKKDNDGLNAFDYAQDYPEMVVLLNNTIHKAPKKKKKLQSVEPESDTKKALRRLEHIKRAMQPEAQKASLEEGETILASIPEFSGLTQTEAHWKKFGSEIEKKYGKILDDQLVKQILAREREAIAQGNYVFYRSEPGRYRVYEYFIEELYRLVKLYSAKNEFVLNRFFKDAAKEPTINEYIDTMQPQAHKRGPEFNVLLSANISLFGNINNRGDCTWDYFLKNREATGAVSLFDMFKRIFVQYGFDNHYISWLLALDQRTLEQSATLQQIIIPKSIVDDVVMFSTSGYCFPWRTQVDEGQADSCWDQNAISLDIDGNLKKGRYTCISTIIDKYRDGRIVIDDRMQVRILMNAVYGLNPESGIKIYQYTRLPKKTLHDFKKQVQKITDEMFAKWLKKQLQSKKAPQGAEDEPLGEVFKHLGKGRRSKL